MIARFHRFMIFGLRMGPSGRAPAHHTNATSARAQVVILDLNALLAHRTRCHGYAGVGGREMGGNRFEPARIRCVAYAVM